MKNLNLINCGVLEMNTNEMKDVTGGTWVEFAAGINAGTGATRVSEEAYGGGFWYTFGYGIGLTVRQGVE